jgi:hypothetical protein
MSYQHFRWAEKETRPSSVRLTGTRPIIEALWNFLPKLLRFLVMGRYAVHPAVIAGICATALAATIPVLPKARDAWHWLAAQDNPETLTQLHLDNPDLKNRWQAAFREALAQEDLDLAESLLALAESQGLVPDPTLLDQYQAAQTPAAVAKRNAGQFYAGATSGKAEDPAGLAGALAADLSGVGDIRDLVLEGRKIARGEDPDELVLGLAAVGLVATGATLASLGLAAPARGGVTTLKVAARAGRISPPLRQHLAKVARDVIDRDQARQAARAAVSLDAGAARAALSSSIRPAAFREIGDMAGDLTRVTTKAGARSAQDALTLARDSGDLRRLARLAESQGSATRAVLKLFGRGAIVLAASAATLASWVFGGVIWVLGALLLLTSMTRQLAIFTARLLFPRGA